MARISNDDDSWNASSIKHRDARHSHDGPEINTKKKKKDTKKWCKGKVGREHEYTTVDSKRFRNTVSMFQVDKCSKCGKETNWKIKDEFRQSWWRK